jgi:DNA-directed RNA polymerase I, II, and III subunit RPABC2
MSKNFEEEELSDNESMDSDEEEDTNTAFTIKKNKVLPGIESDDDDDEESDDEEDPRKTANIDGDEMSENEENAENAEMSDDDDDRPNINVSKFPQKLGISDDEEEDEEEEEEEDDDEKYLQKFEETMRSNIIQDYHPEMRAHNNEEIEDMCRIVRNEHGVIIDPLHRTLPFITKYEKARILGERAKQLNSGGKSFIKEDPEVIDGYLIALEEFNERKIPFIIRRPLPNGGCEYWKVKDLEILAF